MGLTFEPNSAQAQIPNTSQFTEESQSHRSQNTHLEGSSRIIWCKLCWHNYNLDKNAQRPVQLNLKSVQCWAVRYFLGETIPVTDHPLHEKFSFPV